MKTRFLALAFFLCTVSLPTYAADWVRLGENTRGDTFFIDKSSLQRDGDSVTFWVRTNFSVRKHGDLSAKTQETVNCRRRETIIRYMMFYDDIDNRGRLTSSLDPKDKWKPIAPETAFWSQMLFVCR